jgi:tRNA pseudouridine32 synthase/23S rRNA pseudouridine746 synthase/23S rRNA pseudouridine1911/1915/1917 synthase
MSRTTRTIVATGATPADLVTRVLYRDGLMLVIDKPAGVPVHAGPGGGPSLEDGFETLRFGLPRSPHLAHRLDRDTSGCLVLGRHRQALARLGRLFAEGRVEKSYWAIVAGAPPQAEGRVTLGLRKRSTTAGGWWMEPDPGAPPAITDYRVRGQAGDVAWVELAPRTGKTHQLRVHLAALGCPVLGDRMYDRARRGAQSSAESVDPVTRDSVLRLHLHARAVTVPLYPRRPPITVVAPPPPHMLAALSRCGFEKGREPR